VRGHVENILSKLDVDARVGIATWYAEPGRSAD
jgi:DNA-binding NarL/FixJ family response regulator